MSKHACKDCPFRDGSPVCYDADALEALNDGMTPSCHVVVGDDSIFRFDFPTDQQRCAGHDLWVEGRAGFVLPSRATGSTHE